MELLQNQIRNGFIAVLLSAHRDQVDVQHLDGCQRGLMKADDISPKDAGALSKVDRQVEQQDLQQSGSTAAAQRLQQTST